MNRVLKVAKDMNLEYYGQNFDLACTMFIKVRQSRADELQQRLAKTASIALLQ
jgi:hypothetical protein